MLYRSIRSFELPKAYIQHREIHQSAQFNSCNNEDSVYLKFQ